MLNGYKILVAEDNALNQKIATYLLNKFGAEVKTVSNGTEAIDELGRNSFDFILMDIQMPEMDGLETTTHIRTVLKSDIPIIALSASSFEDEYKQCLEVGMNACIVKPIDVNKLSEILDGLSKENKINSRNACL